MHHQVVLNLMGCSLNPICLVGETYNLENRLRQHKTENNGTSIFFVHFYQLFLCYLFYEYPQAVEKSILAAGHVNHLASTPSVPHLLTCAGISGGMAPIVRPGSIQELGLLADRILFPLTQQQPLLAQLILQLVSQLPPILLKYILLLQVSSVSDRTILSSLNLQQATDFFFEAFRSGSRGTVKDYQIMGGEWGFRLEDISMPILLWQGEQDNLLPMAHAQYLAKQLPLGQLIVVPDCGHFLPRSKMSEILTALVG